MIYICKFSIYLKDSFWAVAIILRRHTSSNFTFPLPPLFKFNPKNVCPKFQFTKLNFSTSFIKIPKITIIVNVEYFSDKVKFLHICFLSFMKV